MISEPGLGAPGNSIATSGMGTRSQSRYATELPNACRTGRRISSTSTMIVLETIVCASSCRRASIIVFDLRNEALEVRNVPLAELAVSAEVRSKRSHAAGKKAVQQTLALAHHPLVARDHG